jgi:hypothetical protein
MDDNPIGDSRRESVLAYWVFAVVLWVVGVGAVLLVHVLEPAREIPYGWLVWYFPVLALATTIYAARLTRQLRRHGSAILKLDPSPGSIGGHVGGRVLMQKRLRADARITCTLSCNDHWRISRPRRSTHGANLVWQEWGEAPFRVTGQGTVLAFRFDVPAGLPASGEPTQEPDAHGKHRWELELQLDGQAVLNHFTVPVRDRVAQSRKIPVNLTEDTAKRIREALAVAHRDPGAASWLRRHHHLKLERSPAGLELHSLAWRETGPALALVALFGLFVVAGLQMLYLGLAGEGGQLGAIAVLSVGAWFGWKILSRLTLSTRVSVKRGGLRIARGALLRPPRVRHLELRQIAGILPEVSATEGYVVHALVGGGEKLLLAEGLKGEQAGIAVAELIARELGMPE